MYIKRIIGDFVKYLYTSISGKGINITKDVSNVTILLAACRVYLGIKAAIFFGHPYGLVRNSSTQSIDKSKPTLSVSQNMIQIFSKDV